jgi:hypothetical protein
MVVDLALDFLDKDGVVCDIGCGPGTTLAMLASVIDPTRQVRIVGFEPADAMRQQALSKLAAVSMPDRLTIFSHSAETIDKLDDARAIIMLYTLQFRPLNRLDILKMCHYSLRPAGCLIPAEKYWRPTPRYVACSSKSITSTRCAPSTARLRSRASARRWKMF